MASLAAIIVAAGKGTRMNTRESKQYIEIDQKPILVHTMEAFHHTKAIDEMIVVVGAQDVDKVRFWTEQYELHKVKNVISGGRERQQSVYFGLQALQGRAQWVLIHDGVRPFVSPSLIERCWQSAQEYGSAVLAVPVKDTIKVANEKQMIEHTPDRNSLWAVQTPQAFRAEDILEAHRLAAEDGYMGTDDASLMERLGKPVKLVMGDYRNIKITTPEDLSIAAHISQELKKKGEEKDDSNRSRF